MYKHRSEDCMTDEQHESATRLKDLISKELQDVVNNRLRGTSPAVEEFVRTLLTEQIRFWKE